jgi:hypothetical protein
MSGWWKGTEHLVVVYSFVGVPTEYPGLPEGEHFLRTT